MRERKTKKHRDRESERERYEICMKYSRIKILIFEMHIETLHSPYDRERER